MYIIAMEVMFLQKLKIFQFFSGSFPTSVQINSMSRHIDELCKKIPILVSEMIDSVWMRSNKKTSSKL